jgi:hypothetical protein
MTPAKRTWRAVRLWTRLWWIDIEIIIARWRMNRRWP